MSERPILASAIVMLRARDEAVWIGRRADSGKWELPAGKVEFGEHPKRTAQRELSEECGIVLPLYRFTPLTPVLSNTYRGDPPKHYVVLAHRIILYLDDGDPKVKPDAHSEGTWACRGHIGRLERDDAILPGCTLLFDAATRGPFSW